MSASDLRLHAVGQADLPALMTGLEALARDLGDPFKATTEDISRALFGPERFALAVLAQRGSLPVGVALAAPLFSTVGDGPVLYVSDLWVDAGVRQQAVGRRLLAKVLSEGAARWQTNAIKLTVYSDNTPAMAFYDKLGFILQEKDRSAFLPRPAAAEMQKAWL